MVPHEHKWLNTVIHCTHSLVIFGKIHILFVVIAGFNTTSNFVTHYAGHVAVCCSTFSIILKHPVTQQLIKSKF
jgi:hypothetical protein